MKLLFDENISPKLTILLECHFPGSAHVRDCGLKGRPDEAVWEYARDQNFTLVSKDSDFFHRSLLLGPPPKLVWLCLGNCTCDQVLNLLLKHKDEICALDSASETILLLR
jgi:predicted nuclease of predicted toxin-antitoxin system